MTQGVIREWFWENHHPCLGGRRTSQLDGHKIWWRNQHLSEGLGRCTTFAWVCKDVMCNIFDITFPLIFRFQEILDRWLRLWHRGCTRMALGESPEDWTLPSLGGRKTRQYNERTNSNRHLSEGLGRCSSWFAKIPHVWTKNKFWIM